MKYFMRVMELRVFYYNYKNNTNLFSSQQALESS